MSDAFKQLIDLFAGTRGLVQGVEGQLLKRQRLGIGGLLTALLGFALGVASLVADGKAITALGDLGTTLSNVIHGNADGGTVALLAGVLLMVAGSLLYVLLRWTRFLQAESQEPFRYTVSIAPLMRSAKEAPSFVLKNEGRLALMQGDLRERLNQRIGRFTLLDAPPDAAAGALPHIHVAGDYSLREDRPDHWVLQVMPTVRLGAASAPVAMAYTVLFELGTAAGADLNPQRYDQVVERVYSSIAREIYRTIETDVRAKIERFPTRYLRAVALYFEARDIARSNTVDAYDLALDLYRDARLAFDMAPWRDGRRYLVNLPFFWRGVTHRLEMRARVSTGHVQCQLFRYMIALQTGRRPNPIFDCVRRMNEVIADLKQVHARLIDGNGWSLDDRTAVKGFFRYRADRFGRSLIRPREAEFARVRRVLFDAYVVQALAHSLLGGGREARLNLDAAAAVDPSLPTRDASYLVVRAGIEPDLLVRARLLRSATDLAPKFQIAQLGLANAVEMVFRQEGALNIGRLKIVMQQYDEVLRINPGNLSAIASQGYLYWLTDQLTEAEQCFREGLDFRAIVRDTTTAELNYGLARVLAETERYDDAYDQYAQAVAADRSVAAWSTGEQTRLTGSYYSFIEPSVIARYEAWSDKIVKRLVQRSDLAAVGQTLQSFALNDSANACLNGWFRSGDPALLDRAQRALERALEVNPTNAVAHLNRSYVEGYLADGAPERFTYALKSIAEAVELAPQWVSARTRAAELSLSPSTLEALDGQIEAVRRQIDETSEQVRRVAVAAPAARHGGAPEPVPASSDGFQANTGKTGAGDGLDARLKGLQRDLRTLEQQERDTRENYDRRLNDAITALTQDARLRELLRPQDDNDAQRWCDNALELTHDSRMRWDLLDETDVFALRALVNATAKRAVNRLTTLDKRADTDLPRAARASERGGLVEDLRRNQELLRFLQTRFYGGDLDLPLAAIEISAALGETDAAADAVVAAAVSEWAQADPSHYWLLKVWIQGRLDLRALVALGERMRRSSLRDPLRMGMMVRQLLEVPFDPKADTHDARVACMVELASRCVAAARADMGYRELLVQVLDRSGDRDATFQATVDALKTDARAQWPPLGLAELSGAFPDVAQRKAHAIQALQELDGVSLAHEHGVARNLLQALQVYDARDGGAQHSVTLVAVEIAPDLVPLVALPVGGGLQPELEADIQALRTTMRASFGIDLPGVRFFDRQGDSGGYRILLKQVPIGVDTVPVDSVFWLPEHDGAGFDVGRAGTDPITGRGGIWLSADERAERPAWVGQRYTPMAFVMRHLQAALRFRLAELVGYAELGELLARLPDASYSAIDASERVSLLTALRSLLFEGVPVLALADIVAALPGLRRRSPHFGAAAESLRKLPAILPVLPGNDGRHRLLEVGKRTRAALREGLRGAPEPVLAFDPAAHQGLMAALQKALPADLRLEPTALVVGEADLRPHLGRLMRLALPLLPVLAEDELTPEAAAVPRQSFDLEPVP